MRQRAVFDVEDPIGVFEQPGVVRHDQHGPAVLPGGAGEDGHDRLAVGAVQRRRRLVGQDRRRFGDNRACNSDALLLAAAQIARERRGLLSKPDPFQDLARFGLSAPALLAADIERELNIFLGSERGEV